jgi:secreted PhoX family phosphatase
MNASTKTEQRALARQEESCNTSNNPSLSDIVDARLSRRNALRIGVSTAGAALLAACGGGDDSVAAAPAPAAAPLPAPGPAPVLPTAISLNFAAVAKNLNDTVTVPVGYTAKPIYALGDPLTAATPEFKNDGTDTDYQNRAGDQHDGIEYFGLNALGTARAIAGSERGLLAMNHEALTAAFLFPNGTTANPRPAAEAQKEIEAHGVSVVEVRKVNGTWSYDKSSFFNRRVTPLTPVTITGPARGNALMRTLYSTDGTTARGTLGNCGTGYTPWGTFLTAEENFAGFFARNSTDTTRTAKENLSFARYGRNAGASAGRGWNTSGAADAPRWNVSKLGASLDGTDDFRNELNTFGYMVEIDPYDKTAAIRKRTGLGRFAHESATFGLLSAGKPVAVYMGDDQAGDYIYKYVSTAAWSAADANSANRIATGDKYLDDGKLYVAKFNADGNGQWIELTTANALIAAHPNGFANQGEVVINARLAADAVGATKMDRPEWCAVHPVTGEVYYTLTNNSGSRAPAAVDAANPRSYSDTFANGAAKPNQNVNGHIIRLRENNGDNTDTTFAWDVYLFGAEATMEDTKIDLSSLTGDQDFSSPDGLWFSQKTGLLFIQTDDGNFTDVSNCMMLIAKPGKVGDGGPVTITGVGGTTTNVTTYVGAKPTADTLRRFLVGPVDCEITGIAETPDGKTIFVNIQHPGDTISNATVGNPAVYTSHWPANAGYGAGGALTARPRSATVAVTRNDGGLIGTDGTAVLNTY